MYIILYLSARIYERLPYRVPGPPPSPPHSRRPTRHNAHSRKYNSWRAVCMRM